MARRVTRPALAVTLLAALPALAGCAALEPSTASTSGRLPDFGWGPWPRMQAPSDERPAWLPPSPPADAPRSPAPSDGFRV